MGAAAIPVALTVLLLVVAWRLAYAFNKDLVRARAWTALARRCLPFLVVTLMALSLPLIQSTGGGSAPLAWTLAFGGALLAASLFSEPLSERRARRAYRSGDYTRAADLYRELVEERPLARYWTFFGAALGAAERNEEAIDASNRAVELDPEYGLAYYNRALMLRRSGRKSRAAKDLEKALAADLPRRFRGAARKNLEELRGP